MKSQAEMQALIEQCGVSAGNGPAGWGWDIMQHPGGLAAFLTAMEALGVKTVLELGTGRRGGLARFMGAILGWNVTSVDIRRPDPEPECEFICASTEEARPLLAGRHFDLVFIDADGYRVRENHAWYAQQGRIVALHDINAPEPDAPQPGFWRELAYGAQGQLRVGFHECPGGPGIGWYIR